MTDAKVVADAPAGPATGRAGAPVTLVRDPLTGRGHLVGQSPVAGMKPSAAQNAAGPCPFCGERQAAQPGVRVLPTAAGPVTVHDNPWPVSRAGHLVLLLADAHVTAPAQVGAAAWSAALLAAWSAFPGHWPLFAANIGLSSGASVSHLHAQAVALPGPAPACEDEAESLSAPHCVLCAAGRDRPEDVLLSAGALEVSVAWGSTELLLSPVAHTGAPTGVDLVGLGGLLHRVWVGLGELGWVAGQVALHHGGPGFHWHAHVTPMAGPVGCLERGGGLVVNRQPPDRFAADLRRALSRPRPAGATGPQRPVT